MSPRTWREQHPFLYGLSQTFGIFGPVTRRDVPSVREQLARSFRDVEDAIAEAEHRESFHPPSCVCGPGVKRFGIACGVTRTDPAHPCPGNGDAEVAVPPTHLCREAVPFTHTKHEHVGDHRCACGYDWSESA